MVLVFIPMKVYIHDVNKTGEYYVHDAKTSDDQTIEDWAQCTRPAGLHIEV